MSILKKLLNFFNRLFKRKKKIPEKPEAGGLELEKEKKAPKPIKKNDRKEYPFAHQVLVRPLVTEKVSSLGADNQYVFEVAKKTNKVEIKKAIQSIYGVEPTEVRVINISGKNVRYGRRKGRTKSWKKAIITLKAGDKIEVYEGV